MSIDKKSLQEMASLLTPCDREKPFIYVSYSTRDGEAVYRSVLALQKAGENIWIDVPQNFNTGEGYNSTIFGAIADKNCRGILLFISEESFTSAQSAKEAAYVNSKEVLDTHGDALPMIGVELVDIEHHDIEVWVQGELYQKFGKEMLSMAEADRIEKYRNKYNNKMGKMDTKFDLAEEMLSYLLQQEKVRVDYRDPIDIAVIQSAIKSL